ncbi:MAG: hypothetical protein KDC85_10675 [Saprospiraceae bacterium]|nr:hypothetical protein [Saprospiraceae bacterium]MCB9323444.1 hypothetical protein [Lewinellaceae bacterium]
MNTSTLFNNFALTFLLLPLAIMSFGQQGFQKETAEKVLIKSFNLQGNEIVSLNLGEPIEVKTWDKSTVRIQMSVSLENGTESILKSLVQAGKYNLKYSVEDEIYTIYGTDLRKQIEVGGTPLLENVSILVYAPENVLVLLPEGTEQKDSL